MRFHACALAIALATATATALPAQTAPPTTTPPPAADAPAPDADAPADDPPPGDDAGGPAPTKTPGDPFENINRKVWGFNQGLDRILIRPVTQGYRFVAPRPARRGISKVFANLSEPWSFINNLLQLKVGRAMNNLGRFVVNTTIGVGGLADQATGLGLKPAPEDFGQTLAVWGVKSSAYVVLPLFGPSTVRDGVGTGVAMVANPYPVCLRRCTDLSFAARTGIQATQVVSIRSDLIDSGADAFLASSLDSYAAARSAYFQNRAQAIANSQGDDGADATPADLDPTSPDAPPADTPATVGDTPSADAPAAPAPPAGTPLATPAAADAPKLSFNLPQIEG